MTKLYDVDGRLLILGSRVAVAFESGSWAYLKVGTLVSLEPYFSVQWDKGGKLSPPMRFDSRRVVVL